MLNKWILVSYIASPFSLFITQHDWVVKNNSMGERISISEQQLLLSCGFPTVEHTYKLKLWFQW